MLKRTNWLCCGLSFLTLVLTWVPAMASSLNVKIVGNPLQSYGFLQLAYDAATTGAVIQAQKITFVEDFTLDKTSTDVTLEGGFDPTFFTQNGDTKLQGTLTLAQGSLVVDHLIIASGPSLVSVAVTPINPGITVDSHQQFTATGTYSDETTQDLTASVSWSSSSPSVADIDTTGMATTAKIGSTLITATTGNIAGTTILAANSTNVIIPTGAGGTNTAGESDYSLYIQEVSGTWGGGGYFLNNITNSLLNFPGLGKTATVPYSASSGSGLTFYDLLSADSSGNLWAVQNTMSNASDWGHFATAIVKYRNASGNPSTLTPTTIVTLPSSIIVNHRVAFDGSGNLWVDEISLYGSVGNTGESARIVEYTAASSYTTTGTVIAYSPYENNSGCLGAGLVFGTDGHLVALENYNNGTGGCNNQIMEYTPTGTPVTSKYYPSGYSGQAGELAIDASNNLWVFSSPGPTNCHYPNCTIPGYLYEVSDTGNLLQTLPAPPGAGGAVLDANGNLWIVGNTNFGEGEPSCSDTYTSYLSELPPGATTPIVAASYTRSCAAVPRVMFGGVAITQVPSTLLQ